MIARSKLGALLGPRRGERFRLLPSPSKAGTPPPLAARLDSGRGSVRGESGGVRRLPIAPSPKLLCGARIPGALTGRSLRVCLHSDFFLSRYPFVSVSVTLCLSRFR